MAMPNMSSDPLPVQHSPIDDVLWIEINPVTGTILISDGFVIYTIEVMNR